MGDFLITKSPALAGLTILAVAVMGPDEIHNLDSPRDILRQSLTLDPFVDINICRQ